MSFWQRPFGVFFFVFVVACAFFWKTPEVFAATRTWDGGGGDDNWSTGANWSDDTVPGSADDAVFNGTSTDPSIVDALFAGSVRSLSINSGYTNTITVSRSLDVGVGGLIIAAGTLNATSQTITVSGGVWTHTAGGTWTPGTGTVSFAGATATVDVATSETFNNLTIAKTAGNAVTITSGDTLVANGILTLTEGNIATGTVNATSTVVHDAAFDGGSGTLLLTGSASLAMTGGGQLPTTFTINGASVTVTGPPSGTTTMDGAMNLQAGTLTGGGGAMVFTTNLSITGGTFTGGSGNIDVNGAFSLASPGSFTSTSGTLFIAGAWTHTDSSTFTHNGGNVTFDNGAATVNVNVTESFQDVTINKTAGLSLTITSGDTLVVAGTLFLVDGVINTGTVEAQNVLTHGAGFDGGANGGRILISGSTTRTISMTGGADLPGIVLNAPNVTLNGPGSSVTVIENIFTVTQGAYVGSLGTLQVSTGAGGDLTVQGGTFTGGTATIDVGGDVIISSTGVFTSTSGTLFVGGAWTHTAAGATFSHNGGTVTFDSAISAGMNVNVSETFNNVTFAKPSGFQLVISSGDTLLVTGTLTLQSGNISGSTGTVEAQGDVSILAGFTGTLTANVGVVEITGGTNTITIPAGVRLPTIVLDASRTLDLPSSGTVTIKGDLDLREGTFAGDAGNVDMNGDLLISGTGLFTAPSGTLFLAGNLTQTGGTFAHNGGAVELDTATSHTLTGTFTFTDLIMEDTTGTTGSLLLDDGTTTTVLGEARLQPLNVRTGLLIIDSVVNGVDANIDFQGETHLFALDLEDITALTATPTVCVYRCVDSGNVSNIRFGEAGFDVDEHDTETDEGGTAVNITVRLRGRPTATVTLPVSVSDSTEASVSSSLLTFDPSLFPSSNPNVTFTVTGLDDSADDGGVDYTVILGAASSGDPGYDGLNPSDLPFVNLDNDTNAEAIGFDSAADFTQEDVSGTGSAQITWFEHTADAQGTFMTASGGLAVNLTGSKIDVSCRAVLTGGTSYTIQKVEDVVNGDVTLTDGVSTPDELNTLLTSTGVTAIYCSEFQGDGVHLNEEDVLAAVNQVSLTGTDANWITNDSTNDAVWITDEVTNALFKVDVATQTLLGTFTTGTGPTDLVYAPATDTVWVVNSGGDSVTAFDAATGAYAFGTFGASTFATGVDPTQIDYDATHNSVWVAVSGVGEEIVTEYSVVDGSNLGDFAVGMKAYGVAVDATDGVVWVSGAQNATVYSDLVKLNSTTGAPANGSLANSTFRVPADATARFIRADSGTGEVWLGAESCAGSDDIIMRIDPDGETEGTYSAGDCASGLLIATATNTVYAITANDKKVVAFHRLTGERIKDYPVGACPLAIAMDDAGDIWVTECTGTVDRLVVNAVPTSTFYTVTTDTFSELDSASWTDIKSVVPDEMPEGELALYTVTFDEGHEYKVHGSWRTIASDETSVHGGTDGDWYYIDDADVWSPSPENTAEDAVSLAVESGPVSNQMTGGDMSALTESQWGETGGFTAAVTSVGFGVTLKSSDPTSNPSVAMLTADPSFSANGGTTPPPGTTPDVTAPVVTGLAVTNITTTTATVSFGTNEAATGRVEWGVTGVYEGGSLFDSALSTSHSFPLSNLAPETTYFVRVTAVDENGNRSSETTSFMTLAEGAEPPPEEPPVEPPPAEEPPPTEPPPEAPPEEPTPTEPPSEEPVPPPGEEPAPGEPVPPAEGGETPPPSEGEGGAGGTPSEEGTPGEEGGIIVPPVVIDVIETVLPEVPVEGAVESANTFFTVVNDVVTTAREEPVVQDTAAVTAIVVAAGAVGSLAVLGVGFELLPLLQYLATAPVLLFKRRLRKSYGVVYDTLTKLPVGLAIVRLVRENGSLVATRVTDPEGRFSFLADPGDYRIVVTSRERVFPSRLMSQVRADGTFADLYHGEPIRVTEKGALIAVNIPLDPTDAHAGTPARVTREKVLRTFQHVIAVTGLTLAVIVLVVSPSLTTLLLAGGQVAVYFLARRLAFPKKPKSWGIVYDEKSGQPLVNAVVRLFDGQYNKIVETQVTDRFGRYFFLVGPNKFFATAEREGYLRGEVRDIDLTTEREPKELSYRIPLMPVQAPSSET